uniref:Peptidase S1 domain-containing protein n=1 Tax=Chelydra serpentina TaxID=8475 RepID=A0A8C3RTW8_CHESE
MGHHWAATKKHLIKHNNNDPTFRVFTFLLNTFFCLKAKLSTAVQLVPLPETGKEVMPRDVCNVAGWGNTRARGVSLPSTLREVDLKVLEADRCLRYPHFVPNSMLCVGDPKEVEKSSFQGDSGGPLVCEGTAQGIVSFGRKDGSPPRVFTRVSAYIPWIKKTMRKLQD